MNSYSAAMILKNSAKQLVWKSIKYRNWKQSDNTTKNQQKGNKNAIKHSSSKYLEMRGTNIANDIAIHFSFDEVLPKKNKTIFIEHKWIENQQDIQEWYIHYSILQVAFYQSLSKSVDEFYTAKFFRRQGNEVKYLKIKNKRIFKLIFSNDDFSMKYKVKVNNHKKILSYFRDKIYSININIHNDETAYKLAELWDKKHKFKDWNFLKDYISYKKIV